MAMGCPKRFIKLHEAEVARQELSFPVRFSELELAFGNAAEDMR